MGMFGEIAAASALDAVVQKTLARWRVEADPYAKAAYEQVIRDCAMFYEWDTSDSYKAAIVEIAGARK